MSSIKQLNREIKHKRIQGKLSAQQSQLLLSRLLSTAKAYTRRNPFKVTGGLTLATVILIKYKKKINYLYPMASLSFKFFKQFNRHKPGIK